MVNPSKNKNLSNENKATVEAIPYGEKITYNSVAEYINKKFHFFYDKGEKQTNMVYVYQNGKYTFAEDLIREHGYHIFTANDKLWREEYVKEIINILKVIAKRKVKMPEPELVNVENGIYNIKTKKLKRHSPSYFFLNKMPIKITNKSIKNSKLEKIVKNILDDENYKLFFEFVGYGLYSAYIVAGCLFIIGGGGNGKSTLMKIIQSMYGEQAVSIPLQEFNNDEKRANLYKKSVNIVAELPSTTLMQTEMFKGLTDGDQVNARFLYHKTFWFNNFAKFIFATNHAPKIIDTSYGLKRRIYTIELSKVLDGSVSEQDISKILETPKEREWFFNEMVEGMHRIWRNGNEFSKRPSKKRYSMLSDSVGSFIYDALTVSENGGGVLRTDVYEQYTEYCNFHNIPHSMRKSKQALYTEIRDKFEGNMTEFEENVGKHLWWFKGIEFTDWRKN